MPFLLSKIYHRVIGWANRVIWGECPMNAILGPLSYEWEQAPRGVHVIYPGCSEVMNPEYGAWWDTPENILERYGATV